MPIIEFILVLTLHSGYNYGSGGISTVPFAFNSIEECNKAGNLWKESVKALDTRGQPKTFICLERIKKNEQ